MSCVICNDEGWVCENHPKVGWNEGYPVCCDTGAGMPCECNKADPPWDFVSPKPPPKSILYIPFQWQIH